MASVFKRKNRDGKPARRWSYWYVDHTGRRVTGTGNVDKTSTQAIADKREQESKLVRAGLKAPADLTAERAALARAISTPVAVIIARHDMSIH